MQDYSFGVQGSRRSCNSSFFLAEHFPQMRGEGGGLAYPTGGEVCAALEHDEGVLAVRGPSAPGCPCLPHPQGS